MFDLIEDDFQDRVVINSTNSDVDFIVETAGDANTLYVVGSTDKVGIGNNLPTEKLVVAGNISASGAINTLSHITASGNISSSGNVIGNLYQPTFHNFSMTGTDELYIPFPTSTTEASTTNYVREWIAPFDGALSMIRARGSAAGGVTTFKLYVNAVIAGGATATNTGTVNWRFADTTYNFPFDESTAVYSAGDILRVTIEQQFGGDGTNVTCIWNYNTDTL